MMFFCDVGDIAKPPATDARCDTSPCIAFPFDDVTTELVTSQCDVAKPPETDARCDTSPCTAFPFDDVTAKLVTSSFSFLFPFAK